jgi:diaminopimelate epimerase
MLLESSNAAIFTMRYFNSDGGESTMCGNGGRCIAAFAVHLGVAPKDVLFEFNAVDGLHFAKVEENLISLKMLDVDGIEKTTEGYFLNTGSPHVVVLSDDVLKVDVFKEGKLIRHDERFKAGGGTNVNFLTIKKTGSLAVRTFERGVEDETWSCRTGSVASAMVANYLENKRNVFDVEVPGGKLKVKFDVAGNGIYRNVWLEGPATYVYEGDFRI